MKNLLFNKNIIDLYPSKEYQAKHISDIRSIVMAEGGPFIKFKPHFLFYGHRPHLLMIQFDDIRYSNSQFLNILNLAIFQPANNIA